MRTIERMFPSEYFRLYVLVTVLTLLSGVYCSVVLNPGPLPINEDVELRQPRRLSLLNTERGHDCRTPLPVKSRFRQYDPNMSVFIIPVEKPREDKAFKAWGGKRKSEESVAGHSLEWMEANVSGEPNELKGSDLTKKSLRKTGSQEDADSSQLDNSNESAGSVVIRRKGGHKFLSWGGKRSGGSFGQWGGKRSDNLLGETGLVKRTDSFNNWGGKRRDDLLRVKRTDSFNNWGGKRSDDLLGVKRTDFFNNWGGKRS